MAYGVAEDPARSPATHLEGLDFPIDREQLVELAADNGAPTDVINLFAALPRAEYQSHDEVVRDFAEAARRFAIGLNEEDPLRDRKNLGREHLESSASEPS